MAGLQPMHRARALPIILLVLAAPLLAGCVGEDAPVATTGDAPGVDAVFSQTDVFPGDYNTRDHRLPTLGPHGVLSQTVTMLPSAVDQKDIMVYVMRPDVPEATKVPVIMDAGPYFVGLEGRDLSSNVLLTDFISHGYAFALVSVRGTGDSGACMDLMGPMERADIDQAVTWLGTQEWSNGNVGMFGGSYDGSTQWEAASTGNPHLKTIVPIASIPDLFSFMIRNGTWMGWTPAQFAAIYWGLYGPVLYNPATGTTPGHTAEKVVCPEVAAGMAASTASTFTGERDPLGWWAARDWRDDVLANYEGSIFIIHGFADGTVEPHTVYPLAGALESKGLVVKHLLGPWGHELPWRADSLEIMRHWYDRWLKDDATIDIGPKVQVMDNLGAWRSETAWPPADATERALYLTPDGHLADAPGTGTSSMLVATMVPVHNPVTFAQRFNSIWKLYEDPMDTVCPSCPVFATPVAERDLRFAAAPRLHITVTPTGPGGHVTAMLYSVDAQGNAQRVTAGSMDLRFADGGDKAKPVTPGAPLVARMELQPTDAVVPAGGKLLLVLHQGSYGLRMPTTPTWPVMLEASGEKSVLLLDTFERGPETFHEAPARIGKGGPR